MAYKAANPLIVQSDMSVLLEVDNPAYETARDGLARFAELEKSPEHIHTYRITRISLWNAAAAGMTASAMIETLTPPHPRHQRHRRPPVDSGACQQDRPSSGDDRGVYG